MLNHGYNKTNSDYCIFFKKVSDGDFVFPRLYLDDVLIAGRDTNKIEKLKMELNKSFAMDQLSKSLG